MKNGRIFFIFILFSYFSSILTMDGLDKDVSCNQQSEKLDEETAFLHANSYFVNIGRLKSLYLVGSKNAQQKKYGSTEPSAEIKSVFESVNNNGTVQLKQMNDITTQKFSQSGLITFGTKDILGYRTVWVNEDALKQQPREIQEYLLSCGFEQTKLSNPDLKLFAASEFLVGLTSFAFFNRARLLEKGLAQHDTNSQQSSESFSSKFFIKDDSSKKKSGFKFPKLKPKAFRALGWATAFIGPVVVIPQTSLEKNILRNHKFDAIESIIDVSNGVEGINFARKALQLSSKGDSLGLPKDELDFMVSSIKKNERKSQPFSTKEYVLCVKDCEKKSKECTVGENNFKEVALCSMENKKCKNVCNKRIITQQ